MAGPLDQLVQLSITLAGSVTPTVPNFGTPAILAYHTHNGDLIRTYSALADMVTDGFKTTEPAYLMAQAILQQNPTVPKFKVIRSAPVVPVSQTMTFTVVDTNPGESIGFSLQGASTRAAGVGVPDGTIFDFHTVVAGVMTTTAIAAAIAALPPMPGITVSSAGAVVTMTVATAGDHYYVSKVLGGTFLDTTAASGTPGTDLTAANNVDGAWFGFAYEWQHAAGITAAALWAESGVKKMHLYTTADSNNRSVASGIGNSLKGLNDTYTFGMYSNTPIQYSALGLAAQRFTAVPGSDTWAYKTIVGATADALTGTDITALTGNNLNYYIAVAGVSIVLNGVCASGLYADLRRGIDALAAAIQVNVYNLLISQSKVPYDPNGIALVGTQVQAALNQYTATTTAPNALLRGDPGFAPFVTLPLIANVATVDKSARILRNVNFTAWAQGAVQSVLISGTVNI